ncbi:acyl-CoA dehydrogenase family protein [Nonomuraea rhodomycinica]|uniref:Acyl-CoA/acyl-ACP dehydrogenase n=1 Tax=Nonomuraea rhodomycinica TaxID=1712872 RepID=A0A7Y6MD92_9ACTN|nr:acyl-CoA dehydrogenase family protein [Nonomuraea rhodomycinica]NUW42364.1 acyl-CoA/acyl-ACP dehydrogenase [Nonomuraea rhodomycinica]
MTLLYSEVEEELRAAVRAVLADRCPPAAVLARAESEPYDPSLWKTLAVEVGVAGLLVPEEHGGAGATASEAAVVLEELGRGVAPVPFFTSSVLATYALVRAGEAGAGEEVGGLLGRLAEGRATAALVVPFAASPYRPWPVRGGVSEAADATGERLSGSVAGVAGADVADVLVVPVPGPDGTAVLYAVDREAAAVEAAPSLDLTRPVATVTLDGAPAARLGVVDLAEVLRFGAGLLASEQLGVAEWCLETTLAYVKERRQFARPVGSFQAVKHRLADLWLDVVRARAAARAAVSLSGEARPDPVAVAVAQAWNGGVAVHVAEEALQLHGGIGMTWEHPVHLFLKRAKADEIALGTPGDHREALASLAGVPGPVPVSE